MPVSSNSQRNEPLESGLAATLKDAHLGLAMHANPQSNMSSDKVIAICVAAKEW